MTSSFASEAHHAKWPNTVEGTQKMYDDWAKTYDPQLKKHGYSGPSACVKAMLKWVPDKNVHIMDIACGTGLVGEELVKAGYSSIDGLDISGESIKLCKEKNIYGNLLCSDVNSNKLDNDSYDVTLCVGCFVPSHMDEESFPELIRITKPGGFIVIIMREGYFDTNQDYNRGGKFEAGIQSMVQQGKWQVAARDPLENYYGDHLGVTLVFKIL